MRLKDLTIGTQLRLVHGVIFLAVVAFGFWLGYTADLLWRETKALHEHSFEVHWAVTELEADVERISRHTREMFLAEDEHETVALLHTVELREDSARRQIATLLDRYLGPRSDIATLNDAFVQWDQLRLETARLIQEGRLTEATARIRPGGVQHAAGAAVGRGVLAVKDFSRREATQIYRAAEGRNDILGIQMFAFFALIALLTLLGAGLLLRGIKGPLSLLATATSQFQRGDLNARTTYRSANEFGSLSTGFNSMADTIQANLQLNADAADLADVMLPGQDLRQFSQYTLAALMEKTGANIGALYLLNAQKTAFELLESIGLGPRGRTVFSATQPEGEPGAALLTRRIQRVTDLPAATSFAFAAATGEFVPREIVTIPLLAGEEVTAVISLASFRSFDEASMRLLDKIWSVLTARLNGVLAFREAEALARRLDHQNRDLDAQAQELAAQSEELRAKNEELEAKQQQLVMANRLKNAFVANMSHELRTPLNSVISLAHVLRDRLRPESDTPGDDTRPAIPAEEYGYLEIIERNGNGLLKLIDSILDLSRVEAGHEDLDVSSFPVFGLVAEVVATLDPMARQKNIALLTLVPDNLPSVVSDRWKCGQILQNLVGNAVKFTEHGQVAIAATHTGNELRITVSDTGIGIAAEHVSHVFDEFHQADDTASRRYPGAGLGLAIARRYAVLLGGHITVSSVLGRGSTFTLSIPLVTDRSRATIAGSDPDAPAQNTGGPAAKSAPPRTGRWRARGTTPNVLVVEDDADNLETLKALLGDRCRVVEATDASSAFEQAREHMPDLILMDIGLPGMDGLHAFDVLRRDKTLRHIPVVAVTASAMKGNREEILARGFDGYLSKPIDPALLEGTLREFLS